MGLYQGGGGRGLQTRPWISARGGGWVTADTMVVYRGGGAYRRDHGSLSGHEGLQKRPDGPLSGVGGGGGATEETMGLYRGEGGYRRDHGSLQRGGGGGAKQILWVSSRGWGAIRGGHHLHLFWWVLSLYSSFDQFPNYLHLFLLFGVENNAIRLFWYSIFVQLK